MPNDEMCFRAQRIENPSELDSNIPRPYHDDALRLLLDVEESVRVDSVRSTRNLLVGRDRRSAADGDVEDL
jgi:hypothetical protein